MRIEIIIDDEAIVKKDCSCKAKAKKITNLFTQLEQVDSEEKAIEFASQLNSIDDLCNVIGDPALTQLTNRADYILETKEAYVEVIAEILGLRADATINRITPAVIKKVDEFINKIETCLQHFKDAYGYYSCLGSLLDLIKTYQANKNQIIATVILGKIKSEIVNILLEEKLTQLVQLACYVTIKRTYAQEVQYLFFMGSDEAKKDDEIETKN